MAGRRNWMLELARHDAHVRSAHPTARLLVVFEIDGPIVDQADESRDILIPPDADDVWIAASHRTHTAAGRQFDLRAIAENDPHGSASPDNGATAATAEL